MHDDLTRRAIIAAHATTNCRSCDATAMPSLSKREAAIVEAWRADVETKSVVHECCEARQTAEAELAKSTSAIERVRALVAALRTEAPRNAAVGMHIRCGVKRVTAKRIEGGLDGTEATDGE